MGVRCWLGISTLFLDLFWRLVWLIPCLDYKLVISNPGVISTFLGLFFSLCLLLCELKRGGLLVALVKKQE